MEKFRFLTSGESHGKGLTAIIEGLPAGMEIDIDYINFQLQRRQSGFGRGGRMQIEADTAEIVSGVRFGRTIGSPLTLFIKNRDFENWEKVMSVNPQDVNSEKAFTSYRPGHADYAGSVKYKHSDLRNVLERSSARQTAVETAVGAVAELFLKNFGIEGSSKILQIGMAKTEEEFVTEINNAKAAGDSLGGKFVVIYKNLPIGLGSYVHWDRKLDGRIAQAVMSIPAVKAVSFGEGERAHEMLGSEFHDQIFSENKKIFRKTNNAGGIEGGMTNGEDLIVKAIMKPIPTLQKPLDTVDCMTHEPVKAHFERSDICAVEACAVIAESRIACVLADEILLKFGGDCISDIKF